MYKKNNFYILSMYREIIYYSALLTGEILANAHILFHLVFHKKIKMFKK